MSYGQYFSPLRFHVHLAECIDKIGSCKTTALGMTLRRYSAGCVGCSTQKTASSEGSLCAGASGSQHPHPSRSVASLFLVRSGRKIPEAYWDSYIEIEFFVRGG